MLINLLVGTPLDKFGVPLQYTLPAKLVTLATLASNLERFVFVVLSLSPLFPVHVKTPAVKVVGKLTPEVPGVTVDAYQEFITVAFNKLLKLLTSNCSAPKSQTSDVWAVETNENENKKKQVINALFICRY